MTNQARHVEAKAYHLAGDLAAARRLYGEILVDQPRDDDASFRLGILEWQLGNGDAALTRVRAAQALRPQLRYRLGEAQILMSLGRSDAAVEVCRRLLADVPDCVDGWFALASALEALGKWSDAAQAYVALLEREPAHADALNNLGNCRRQLGEWEAARLAYRLALAARPGFPSALTNLGTLLQSRGGLDEAIELLREAATVDPETASHHANLGVALAALGRFVEAADVLARACALDAHSADIAYNFGNVLHALGRRGDAIEQYERALALALQVPTDAACAELDAATERSATYNNLGNVLKDTGALDDAVDCYRRAISCDPGNLVAHSNLAYARMFQLDDGYAILDECRRMAQRQIDEQRAHANARIPEKRLRVGYVSPDFRDHCQSLFTVPVFENHDHEAFEIVCYSSVERVDAMTHRLAGLADRWREVRELSDEQLADVIREDGIDVLVDLTMHMADGRPLLFARQSAPVQVAWLAYPGTTGSRAIGYRLTDPWLDPIDERFSDDRYSERSIRLPESFWCYDALSDEPFASELPAARAGYLTFGCLNNPCKLTDHTMRLWASVLEAVPDSRLMLMAPQGSSRDRLLGRLAAQGVDTSRVQCVPFRPRAAYLRTYHEIDVALDTYPYNGHTTSLDALWMGVPVVTRVGTTPASRAGLSQLSNLGLEVLAADSDDEYIRIATALAADRPALAALRRELRPHMQRSPLMDAARFARHLERAYRAMWREWCASGARRAGS